MCTASVSVVVVVTAGGAGREYKEQQRLKYFSDIISQIESFVITVVYISFSQHYF